MARQPHRFMTLAEVLTAAKSETFRWSPARKAVVVEAVRDDKLSKAALEQHFGVSAEELGSWGRSLDQNGVAGLRSTRMQIYEPQRRERHKAPAARRGREVPAVLSR